MFFYFEPFESQFLNYLLNLLTYTFLYLTIIFLITIYQIRKEDKMNLKRKKNSNSFIITESNIIKNHKHELNKENKLYKFKKNKSSNNMKYIDKMTENNPLNSINELVNLLKKWKDNSDSETIGDLKGRNSNPTPLIWININNKMYKIHTDTKRKGIEMFIQNHENDNQLIIIKNRDGIYNKITNDSDNKSISGLYFYSLDVRDGIEIINTN